MSENRADTQQGLQGILDAAPGGVFGLTGRRVLLIAGLLLAVALVLWLMLPQENKAGGQYITEAAAMGKLTVTVSATGTLQPTKSVDVGSEQSGTLASVFAQENDHVRQGQLLAQLDTARLRDAVTRSQALLAAAEASVQVAQATVAESRASLARMQEVSRLSGGKVPARTELEAAEAAQLRAIASEASARAAVAQAQAVLKTDETNLSKGTIRSPVDGVVLARRVEPGQTVVAAMNTPVLFTLAEDLTRMELQVKVDEADVGTVKPGQPAGFTVSAWPGRQFPANIRRVGLGSTITDNVVTYKTVLEVRNDDLALRPGMTATASIITARRENVLLVPNAALRFTPPQALAADGGTSFVARLFPRLPAERKRQNGGTEGVQQVWVIGTQGQKEPEPVPVQTGVSNGRQTEITGGNLKAGMAVITDYRETAR